MKDKTIIQLDENDQPILYECQSCGDMTPTEGICFMCEETKI